MPLDGGASVLYNTYWIRHAHGQNDLRPSCREHRDAVRGREEGWLKNAPAVDAAHAVGSVGVWPSDDINDISGEVVERFRRFWEKLSAFASSRRDDRVEILKAYDLWFVSGRFDPEWAFDRLDLVTQNGRGNPLRPNGDRDARRAR